MTGATNLEHHVSHAGVRQLEPHRSLFRGQESGLGQQATKSRTEAETGPEATGGPPTPNKRVRPGLLRSHFFESPWPLRISLDGTRTLGLGFQGIVCTNFAFSDVDEP